MSTHKVHYYYKQRCKVISTLRVKILHSNSKCDMGATRDKHEGIQDFGESVTDSVTHNFLETLKDFEKFSFA